MQFDTPRRGFGLSEDGPLDMRMDPKYDCLAMFFDFYDWNGFNSKFVFFSDPVTAADVVNSLSEDDLALIFKKYGEEQSIYACARAIVQARYIVLLLNDCECTFIRTITFKDIKIPPPRSLKIPL